MNVVDWKYSGKVQGVYIHIPFCVRKCPYCDFVSGIKPSSYSEEYFKSLEREIKIWSEIIDFSCVKTLYFGGGTPSLFPSELEKIANFFLKKSQIQEITVEVNPYSGFSPQDFGFATRISFGVQSLSEKHLKFLGRDHSPSDSLACIEKAKNYFSVNADLIFGIPEQTPEEHLYDIKTLVDCGVDHISCYLLEIHEGTEFARYVKDLPDDVDGFFDVQDYLEENGFIRYEVSNFAKPGKECKHNLLYWNRDDFLGIGVSAWSKIKSLRFANTKNIKKYIELLKSGALPVEEKEYITGFREVEEIIFLGLRKLQDGIKIKDLSGVEIQGFLREIKNYDFFVIDDDRIILKKNFTPQIDAVTVRMIQIAERFYISEQKTQARSNLF